MKYNDKPSGPCTIWSKHVKGVGIGIGSMITHSCESEVMVENLTLCYVAKGSGKVRELTTKE